MCVNLQLSQLKKDDLVALGKAIDGFLSSDIGKMAQVVVFAAFPEMKIVKDVAMPVMRQFIKKVTTNAFNLQRKNTFVGTGFVRVLDFYFGIFQDWKVLENDYKSWKVLGICKHCSDHVIFTISIACGMACKAYLKNKVTVDVATG